MEQFAGEEEFLLSREAILERTRRSKETLVAIRDDCIAITSRMREANADENELKLTEQQMNRKLDIIDRAISNAEVSVAVVVGGDADDDAFS